MADMNDERLDRVGTLSKAALAIGAGAALFYRGGGNEAMSKGFRRAVSAFDDAFEIASKESFKTINGNGKNFIKKAYSDFSESYSKNENVKQFVRTDSTGSLFDSLQTAFSLDTKKGRESLLNEMYNKSVFIPNLKKEMYNELEISDERKVNGFVDDVLAHIDDYLTVEGSSKDGGDFYKLSVDFAEKYKNNFDDAQLTKIEDVINRNYESKKTKQKDFITAHKDMLEDVIDKQLDIDSLESKFGTANKNSENYKKSAVEKAFDAIMGDEKATLKQYVDNIDSFENQEFIKTGDENSKTFFEMATELIEKDSRYGDLYVDSSLRIDSSNNIRSFDKLAEAEQKMEEKFLYTMPGRLMKPLETRVFKNKAPNNVFIGKGTVDYQLPKLLDGVESTTMKNSYFRINDKGYKVINNKLVKEEKMDNLVPVSGMYGSHVRLLKNITGDVDYDSSKRNYVFDKLDISSSAKRNPFENTHDRLRKFKDEDWSKNVYKAIMSPESKDFEARTYYKKAKQINDIFKNSTDGVNRATSIKMANGTNDLSIKRIFEMVSMNDDDLLKAVREEKAVSKFINGDAISIINKYKKNPAKVRGSVSIKNKTSDFGLNLKYSKSEDTIESLRKELTKEGLLRYRNSKGADELIDFIDGIHINEKEKNKVKDLAIWGILQDTGDFGSNSIGKDIEEFEESKKKLLNLFLSDTDSVQNSDRKFKKVFQKRVRETVFNNSSIIFDKSKATEEYNSNIIKANRPGEYVFVKKRIKVLDIIKAQNTEVTAKAYAKQFNAGRKNMEDFTTMSFYPYFSLFRLVDAVPDMSFSPKNTGSFGKLAKEIIMKRALPIAGAIMAVNYLDFESRNITGVGLKEASVNSWANFDLGVRSMIDKTPLRNKFKNSYYTNVASNYMSENEYRDAQEQSEWLKTGVSPVRQGRWWSISNTEFRGSKIEYFEPNKLRQASTPWKDIGVYGSSDEKWKHSLMPTLRHPLSPLTYMLNPYWLEQKNKYSRPYPLSSPLFNDGAPWSAIGNATIGQLIKPKKLMNKAVLGKDYVDVRDIIEKQNKKIKAKENNDKYIMLTGSDSATNESDKNILSAKASVVSESGSEKSGSVSAGTGNGTGYAADDNVAYKENTFASRRLERNSHSISFKDKLKLSILDPGLILPQLEEINARIKNKAASRGTAETNYVKKYDQMVAADTIKILRDKDVKADLRNMSSTNDFLRNTGYSMKELGGIYGFIFDEILPGKKQYRLENASSMGSFTKRFWDESVGGFGGEFMEIARRFFPHKDRNNIEINPLRNSMPSWMPESFHHGDPYTKIKKGEIRLPGKAYEAINNFDPMADMSINPNMIGLSEKEIMDYYLNKETMDSYFSTQSKRINVTDVDIRNTEINAKKAQKTLKKLIDEGKINSGEMYSDYTKFKILADVAPFSDEYKFYKSKAKDELTSANKKDYYETLDRVQIQSSTHDFYNYKYAKKDFVKREAYIDEITKDGFTVSGEDTIYSMAGIKASKEVISTKMGAGMKVILKYDKLDEHDERIKAVVYSGGNNLNKELADEDIAERSSDGDAIDAHALSSGDFVKNKIIEIVGHAPIPFFHNKFMKIENAQESYKSEQVYGTSYSTWSHPIQGYIIPAFNEAAASNPLHSALGAAAFASSIYFNDFAKSSALNNRMLKEASKIANLMITPGAAAGALISFATTLGPAHIKAGARIGSAIWGVQYMYVNSNNPILSATFGAGIGKLAGEFLEKNKSNKYALAGTAVGLGISYAKTGFNANKINEKWVPKRTKKRWEIEEYFDRIKYIKYSGLYEKAARKALVKEHVNIKGIISDFEKQEGKRDRDADELLKYKQKLSNSYVRDTKYGEDLLKDIDDKLVNPINSVIIESGEFTKSALAYKQAMDSTIYGLQENASWAQVLRALPKNDRDFFLEFAKVKDKKEQSEILKMVSPYKQNVLRNLWGLKEKDIESNASFFSSHKLPGMFWGGWKPKNNIDNVEIKTIKNEGMLISDFGFYESAAEKPGYDKAEGLDYDKSTSILSLQKNLISSLNGLGLIGVNVSVEPSQLPGIQMVTDFIRTSDYKVKKRINESLGRTYY